MAPNRITLVAILALALLLLAGCGSGGDGTGTADAPSEQEADAELLSGVLSRQLGAVEVYERVLPGLRGRDELWARQFRAQEQEHAEAIVKALRGLGAAADAEPEAVDIPELRDRAERLGFLYELEGKSIDYELSIVTRLSDGWPRSLLSSIVANQAQHRLVIRQLLGDRGTAAIPSAFEDGTDPADQ